MYPGSLSRWDRILIYISTYILLNAQKYILEGKQMDLFVLKYNNTKFGKGFLCQLFICPCLWRKKTVEWVTFFLQNPSLFDQLS